MILRAAMVLALATAVTAAPAAGKTPLPGFRSPTGNIRCFLLSVPTGNLLCSIQRADYSKTLQDRCLNPHGQKGAGVDWHGFLLPAAKRGEVNCSGGILYNPDTQRPTYVNLAYGKTWRHAGLTCASRATGITCRNARGHGIFVSRGAWRTW